MYKFGFGLQPVIDGLAVSHSTLDVQFVSTKSDCMFQHRIWWGTWQHCSDGIHGHLDRLRTVARSENGFIRIEARVFLNSSSSANNTRMRSRLFSCSAISVLVCAAQLPFLMNAAYSLNNLPTSLLIW